MLTIYFKDKKSKFTRINSLQAKTLGTKSIEEAVGKTGIPVNDKLEKINDIFNEIVPFAQNRKEQFY